MLAYGGGGNIIPQDGERTRTKEGQEVTWKNYSIHFPLVTKIANYVSRPLVSQQSIALPYPNSGNQWPCVNIEICRLPPPEISANNIYFRQDGGGTSQFDDLEVGVFLVGQFSSEK